MRTMGISISPSSGRRLARRLISILVVLAVIEVIAVVVFRTTWPPAIRAIRRLNRAVLNPAMLQVAGSAHWYASVVHHVGRTSGRAYETPVIAERHGEYLYIPLPYGKQVDWCANVLAAGGCAVVRKGEPYATTEARIVPAAEGFAAIPPRLRRSLALFGVGEFLRLRIVE